MSMILAATPLVKYDNPVLVSKSTDRKAKVTRAAIRCQHP